MGGDTDGPGIVNDLLSRARVLEEAGEAYALATVVRVDRPVAARAGDRAVITADGLLHGWVGGSCTEPIVVREALAALADGAPRLVLMRPAGTVRPPEQPGVVTQVTTCASEGGVDVFVEPRLPKARVFVVGSSPATRSLVELAAGLGYRTLAVLDDPAEQLERADGTISLAQLAAARMRRDDAIVVGTMNRYDEAGLRAALQTAAGYIGLVASRRRGKQVREKLEAAGLSAEELSRIVTPAGVDLGPCTQEEIGLAVLADLVAHKNLLQKESSGGICAPTEAVDPVCGMTVTITSTALSAEVAGTDYYFCGPGCRDSFTLKSGSRESWTE
jgi:xanthine dehydrogenase accessory factor